MSRDLKVRSIKAKGMLRKSSSYLISSGLAAAEKELCKISETLGFDVMELWIVEKNSGNYTCSFVDCVPHVSEDHPDLICERFPGFTMSRKTSIKMCKLASSSMTGCVWRSSTLMADGKDFGWTGESIGDASSKATKDDEIEDHFAMAEVKMCCSYMFDRKSTSATSGFYVVGYSFQIVAFSDEKLEYLHQLSDFLFANASAGGSRDEDDGDSDDENGKELDFQQNHVLKRLATRTVSDKVLRKIGKSNCESGLSLKELTEGLSLEVEAAAKKTVGGTIFNGMVHSDSVEHLFFASESSDSEDPQCYLSIHKLEQKVSIPENLTMEKFTDISYLTDGSNANVYLAMLDGKKVIIKIIKQSEVSNGVAVKEFEDEYQLLARINHKNIIRVLGCGVVPRRFIVLEYLEGGTVSKVMAKAEKLNKKSNFFRRPAFSYEELLVHARDMAEAFDYLHRRCHRGAMVIHRDLKPDNIGFSADGSIKLFDFGLAICVRARHYSSMAYDLTGNTGSLRYMAPEVAVDKPYTEKVDVHSYGIVLWQMASELVPFAGMNKAMFMEYVVQKGTRPMLDKNWPDSFNALLAGCWNENPNKRPSFAVIVTDLNQMILELNEDDGPPSARGVGGGVPSSSRTASSST